jgi:hypothetical protein
MSELLGARGERGGDDRRLVERRPLPHALFESRGVALPPTVQGIVVEAGRGATGNVVLT